MMQQDQLAFTLSGSALKSRGQELALKHAGSAWLERTLMALREYCEQRKAIGQTRFAIEDFRASREHDAPASHYAWGSIPGKAIRLGIIRYTGEHRKAESLKTHAHDVRVYEAI